MPSKLSTASSMSYALREGLQEVRSLQGQTLQEAYVERWQCLPSVGRCTSLQMLQRAPSVIIQRVRHRQAALNLGNDKEEQERWRHGPQAVGMSPRFSREDGETPSWFGSMDGNPAD